MSAPTGIYNVLYYGAVGNGMADDTIGIRTAIAMAASAGGGICYFPPGTYLISGTISADRSVLLQGAGANVSVVMATSLQYLTVTGGGGPAPWSPKITDLAFDGVGIWYGSTSSDYANGAAILDCEIRNVAGNGVTYTYNSWITLIHNTKIHNCTTGVYFDFGTGGANSGGHMKISDSAIFNCTTGVYVYGTVSLPAVPSGVDVAIVNTDIEHCSTAIKTYESGQGTIFWKNAHAELNSTNIIDQNGSTEIFIDGLWALSYGGGFTYSEVFKSTSGYTYVSNANLIWSEDPDTGQGQLVTLAGGIVVFDVASIRTNNTFYGLNGTPAASGGSTGGAWLNGGKLFAAQVDVTYDLDPGGSATCTLTRVNGFDMSARTIEFDVVVTAVPGSYNVFRTQLNSITLDISLPLTAGGGHFKIVYLPGGDVSVSGIYNGVFYRADSTDSFAQLDNKFVNCSTVAPSGTPATIWLYGVFEYVH